MRRQRFPVLRLLPVVSVLAGLAMFSVRTGTVAAQPPFQVIARNLDTPRGLAFGSDGALYVA